MTRLGRKYQVLPIAKVVDGELSVCEVVDGDGGRFCECWVDDQEGFGDGVGEVEGCDIGSCRQR